MAEPTQPASTPAWATTGIKTAPSGGYISAGWTSATKPPASYFNWWMDVVNQWVSYFLAKLNILPGANANEVLTITAGSVTPTQGNSTFQNAGGTVNNAVTSNFNAGRLWTVTGNGSNTTTLNSAAGGAGQMVLGQGASIALLNKTDSVTFQLDASGYWQEISRSAGLYPAAPKKTQRLAVITASGTWAVPSDAANIVIEAVGPGGNGGNGGGSGSGGFDGGGGTGGGGGAGAIARASVVVTPGETLTLTLPNAGTVNPTTAVGTFGTVTAAGGANGAGGGYDNSTPGSNGAAGAGVVTATQFGLSGSPVAQCFGGTTLYSSGSAVPGATGVPGYVGGNAGGFGGGGGGGGGASASSGSGGGAGGSGAKGVILIYY